MELGKYKTSNNKMTLLIHRDVIDPFVIHFLKVCAGCTTAHSKDPEGKKLLIKISAIM